MKKLFLAILFSLGISLAYAQVSTIPSNKASAIRTDTTNFNKNLSGADTTAQKALDTLDDLVAGSGSVSDEAYGASWDGDATQAPSRNAVYDKIQTLTSASGIPGLGTAGQVTYWGVTDAAISGDAGLTYTPATDKLTLAGLFTDGTYGFYIGQISKDVSMISGDVGDLKIKANILSSDATLQDNKLSMLSSDTGVMKGVDSMVSSDISVMKGKDSMVSSDIGVMKSLDSTISSDAGVLKGRSYITKVTEDTLTNEQALSALASGYAKITTTTGVVSTQAVPIPIADGGTGSIVGYTTVTNDVGNLKTKTTIISNDLVTLVIGKGGTGSTVGYTTISNDVGALKTLRNKSFVIRLPRVSDDFPILKAPQKITITSFDAYVIGGTNVVGQLRFCNSNFANCLSADTTYTLTSGSLYNDASFTTSVITKDTVVSWDTMTVSGTPTWLFGEIIYTEN